MELSFEGIHKRRPLHGGEEGQPKADTCGQWGKGVKANADASTECRKTKIPNPWNLIESLLFW